jgi:diaminopimelate decarboxylase
MSPPTVSSLLRREIANLPVADLARDFGTPTYVYDEDRIVERIADLRGFDVVRYAVKANSNLAILDLCRRQGVLADAVSAGEVHRAMASGYSPSGDPPPIVYTADTFDRDSIAAVLEHGIHVNCGSPDMIDQYGERAPGRDITLRINPGFGHGHSLKTNTGGEHSKHGIWHEDLEECLRRAERRSLRVSGIHAHIGSGADLEHLALVSQAVESFARSAGPTVKMISAGGGLPVPYHPDDPVINLAGYLRTWDASRKRLEDDFGHAVRLEIEPGRYLVAESGYLVTEIRAVKKMGKNLFYLVDAGFNNLARPVLYGAYHPMSIVPSDGGDRREMEVVVGGPLCESGDIFTQEYGGYVRTQRLPEAKVGELLVIECAGAYGFTMSSNYNSKPHAAEVLVSGGKAHLVRARQSLDDLVRGESIPPSD